MTSLKDLLTKENSIDLNQQLQKGIDQDWESSGLWIYE